MFDRSMRPWDSVPCLAGHRSPTIAWAIEDQQVLAGGRLTNGKARTARGWAAPAVAMAAPARRKDRRENPAADLPGRASGARTTGGE